MVDPGLPRQVVCLAVGQTRQDTECGSKACALAKSWCLTTCLTPTTAIQEGHGRETLAFGKRCTSRAPGVYTATVLVRGRYLGPLPG